MKQARHQQRKETYAKASADPLHLQLILFRMVIRASMQLSLSPSQHLHP